MNEKIRILIDRLESARSLTVSEYEELINAFDPESAAYAAERAVLLRQSVYGNDVYIRGLVEIGNVCKNDCIYCGIRRSNKNCDRYRLTKEQIISCCRAGYELGFRTFVFQGGEGGVATVEFICDLVAQVKSEYPDCAVTLSLGEYSRKDYEAMFNAGADRYLLRHETANKEHYEMLHPAEMSYENRMRCLYDLRDIGFQVGCGFMVGSPYQTSAHLANDLKFIEEFSPDMCGIGPFIPHKDTPFGEMPAGQVDLTLYLLSLIRLIKPNILLPATTALGSLQQNGRERGILAGANVVMPNLSPVDVRDKYALYDNKLSVGAESAEGMRALAERMKGIGYNIVTARGDIKK